MFSESIFRPFDYLKIKWAHGKVSKKVLDIYIPLVIGVFIATLLCWIAYKFPGSLKNPLKANIFDNEITYFMAGFLQTIPGFYIAALAAISTFSSTTMDEDMVDPAPQKDNTNISRRFFLSQLFAYLSALSLLAYFITIVARYLSSLDILVGCSKIVYLIIYFISTSLYVAIISQLIILTGLGLYYLGDRIHKNNPKTPQVSNVDDKDK